MRKILSIVLIVSVLLTSISVYVPSDASAKHSFYPLQKNDPVVTNALNYLRDQQNPDGSIGGFSVTAWTAIAISSADENPHKWGNLVNYLKNHVNLIDSTKATDWERQLLAIVACNENPKSFGGINYITKVKGFYDGVQIGDPANLYDDIFGILSLIAAGIDRNSTMIQTIKTHVEKKQRNNGGWGDVDTTAAAVMALVAAGENKNSDVINNALLFIKNMQTNDGGFQSWGQTNAASTAWAVMAITAAGQNPTDTRWQINGFSPVDFLLNLQQENGGFKWSVNQNFNPQWMTCYVIPALLGKPLPIKIYKTTEENCQDDADNGVNENNANVTVNVWTGSIRIEGKNHTVWSGIVSLSSSLITALNDSSGEMEEYTIPYPSVLGALDEASRLGGFSYSVIYYPSWNAFYVKTIAGESDWWHYLVDYNVPMVDAGKYELTSKDKEILWGYLEDWYVHVLRVDLDKTVVNQSEEFTVTVYNESMAPVKGAVVHVSSFEYTSNEEGKVTVKIETSGEYMVYAEKNGFVRSNKIKVFVGKKVEIAKPLHNAIYLWNTKLGIKTHKTFVFGAVDVKVRVADNVKRVEFYVDGKMEYTDDEKPFEWKLNKFAFLKEMTIEVKGYKSVNNTSNVQQIMDCLNVLSKQHSFILLGLMENHLRDSNKSFVPEGYDSIKVTVTNLFPFFR